MKGKEYSCMEEVVAEIWKLYRVVEVLYRSYIS